MLQLNSGGVAARARRCCTRAATSQGLTLVHFSAQPEPFLSLKYTNPTRRPSKRFSRQAEKLRSVSPCHQPLQVRRRGVGAHVAALHERAQFPLRGTAAEDARHEGGQVRGGVRGRAEEHGHDVAAQVEFKSSSLGWHVTF